MKRLTIPIEHIRVDGLIRRPRTARVAAIARMIFEDGQQTPIEVSSVRGEPGFFQLTRGWVRLEAAKSLNFFALDANVVEASRAQRRKREIEDNLGQDGNTVMDRARYLAAGKLIYEAEHPETRHGGARRGVQAANLGDLKPYSGWAAERYGMAERSIQRACTIGEALDPIAAEALAETRWADHQQGLEALVRLSSAEQRAVALLLTSDTHPAASMADAIELAVGSAPVTPEKKRWSAALSNYASMGMRERRGWLRQLHDDELLPTGVTILFEGGE